MIIICINLIWNTKVLSYSFLVNLICLQNKDTKANHCTKGHFLRISAGCQRLLPNSRIWHHGNKNVFHIPGSNVISFSIDPQVFPRVPGHLPHLPYHPLSVLSGCESFTLWCPNSCLFPVSLHLNSFIKVTYWHLFIFLTDLNSWPRFETPNIYFGINKEANREPNKWSVTAEMKFQLSAFIIKIAKLAKVLFLQQGNWISHTFWDLLSPKLPNSLSLCRLTILKKKIT